MCLDFMSYYPRMPHVRWCQSIAFEPTYKTIESTCEYHQESFKDKGLVPSYRLHSYGNPSGIRR